MSSDNSRPSESNRSSRYERATAAALEQATEPPKQTPQDRRQEQRQREATKRQADEDRKKRGQSRKIDDISALFGGPTAKPDSRGAGPPAGDDAAPDAGREGNRSPSEASSRPALELDEDEREEDGEGRPKRKAKAKLIAEFAEAHELDAKELYELAVPLEAGEAPVTIAALKDHFKETRDFEQKRDDFQDWHDNAQNEIITFRQQIENVVQRLTSVIPPEALGRAYGDMQNDFQAAAEKGRAQLAEWFPEWADVQVKVKDRERLETVLGSYGFSKIEVGSVRDARLIKFAMDAIRKADRYDRLKEQGKRDKIPSKEPTSTRKPRQPNATDQARVIADKGDKIGAVAKLLGG